MKFVLLSMAMMAVVPKTVFAPVYLLAAFVWFHRTRPHRLVN